MEDFAEATHLITCVELPHIARGPEAAGARGCARHLFARADAAV